MMVNVGVIGLGMMGQTHLDVYSCRKDVRVVAVSDKDPERLAFKTRPIGNIEGQASGCFDPSNVKKYEEAKDLIADSDIDMVDICLPTPLHLEYAKTALAAGKHLLIEKPLALTSEDSYEIAQLADCAVGLAMPAMCMRFWPGWTWLKEAIDNRCYGKVLAASFRRLASHPDPNSQFYTNGNLCGGGILDFHIHDTDFIQYCFGMPKAVTSFGYSSITNRIDHVLTQYIYEDVPLVVAEGGWTMAENFSFQMQFNVNFQDATAVFDIAKSEPLMLYENNKQPRAIELSPGMGYEYEIAYFIKCINNGRSPQIVTLRSAADTVKIIEAEIHSVKSGLAKSIMGDISC